MTETLEVRSRLLLSVGEAAERLGISERSVFRLLESGELPARKIGRRTLIRADDLERFARGAA
jgi:excisionase family DNA binding protein